MEASIIQTSTAFSFLLTSLLIEDHARTQHDVFGAGCSQRRTPGWICNVAGVALGLAIVGLIAAIGVAEIIQASDILYEALRWAGVAFLMYLAWEGWWAWEPVVRPSGDHSTYFVRGLLAIC